MNVCSSVFIFMYGVKKWMLYCKCYLPECAAQVKLINGKHKQILQCSPVLNDPCDCHSFTPEWLEYKDKVQPHIVFLKLWIQDRDEAVSYCKVTAENVNSKNNMLLLFLCCPVYQRTSPCWRCLPGQTLGWWGPSVCPWRFTSSFYMWTHCRYVCRHELSIRYL